MLYRNIIGSEIRKRRDRLEWSQDDLAARLQLAGWDIDRSQVSKIECRLVHLSDFQLLFLARVFKVPIDDLYPRAKPEERVDDFLARTMPRRRAPVPRSRGKTKR